MRETYQQAADIDAAFDGFFAMIKALFVNPLDVIDVLDAADSMREYRRLFQCLSAEMAEALTLDREFCGEPDSRLELVDGRFVTVARGRPIA